MGLKKIYIPPLEKKRVEVGSGRSLRVQSFLYILYYAYM